MFTLYFIALLELPKAKNLFGARPTTHKELSGSRMANTGLFPKGSSFVLRSLKTAKRRTLPALVKKSFLFIRKELAPLRKIK